MRKEIPRVNIRAMIFESGRTWQMKNLIIPVPLVKIDIFELSVELKLNNYILYFDG